MRKLITYSRKTMLRRVAIIVAASIAATMAPVMRVNRAMRTMRNLLLAGLIPSFCCSLGNAQIIYSNAFNGGAANINQKPPTLATDNAGGASSAIWRDAGGAGDTNMFYANGNVGTAQGDSIILPFTPENGYVYTLTASVTFNGDPGNWIGAGFAQYYQVPGIGNAQFNQGGINGYDWGILTESSGNLQFFAGPATTGSLFNQNAFFTAGTGTHTLTLTLNTTGTQWVIACSVDGAQAGSSYTYTSQPVISAIGITQHTLTTPANIHWNSFTLAASGTRTTSTVNATVSFSGTGKPINTSFAGLSYEKSKMTTIGYFSSTNTSLINLYSTIVGPAVLRIAGGTVDTTIWGGISNTFPITAAEVDDLAGFMNALPENWSVIYGINLLSNTPANAAAEASYVANDLGTRLAGFEIGNEPEFGFSSYSSFLARWQPLAAAITNGVTGWDGGTGSDGWILDGADAGQGQLSVFTDPFASSESGKASLLTQHYYNASTANMQQMLTADPFLVQLATNIVGAASGHQSLGARITECGSYSAGGALGVSDAFGAALWSLDFMFTVAVNGCQGVNFHGGGKSPYSPLKDNGTVVTSVGPEFYGLKMFSLIPPGNAVPATLSVPSGVNFTAYGVKCTGGGMCALLNNKEVNDTISASVNLGSGVSSVGLISLTAPNLFDAGGYTLGGSSIYIDGTWTGAVESVLSATNGQLTVSVPPTTAYLLIPFTWHSWDNPGGGVPASGKTFISAFANCSWASNRLDIFGIGSDNQLYHTYWNGSAWGANPWELHTLPATPAGGPGASATSLAPNRLDDYFIGTDGNCYHQSWNSSSWSAWENLGHPSGTTLAGSPSADSWASGRYDVYCKGADNSVYRKYWTGGAWSAWTAQGGNIVDDPASFTWAPNNLDAYVVGTDNHIWHQYWNGSAFIPGPTSWQEDLPEITTSYSVGVSTWGVGRQDMFVNTGSSIAHNWYDFGWNPNWNETITPPVTPTSAPCAISWGIDRIDVVVLGSDGKCYHTYYGK